MLGTKGVTADILYPIVWEAVCLLEASGVKVICITADGASPNREFFRMHTKLLISLSRPRIPMQKMSAGFTQTNPIL